MKSRKKCWETWEKCDKKKEIDIRGSAWYLVKDADLSNNLGRKKEIKWRKIYTTRWSREILEKEVHRQLDASEVRERKRRNWNAGEIFGWFIRESLLHLVLPVSISYADGQFSLRPKNSFPAHSRCRPIWALRLSLHQEWVLLAIIWVLSSLLAFILLAHLSPSIRTPLFKFLDLPTILNLSMSFFFFFWLFLLQHLAFFCP